MRQIRFQRPGQLCSSRHLVYHSSHWTLHLCLDFGIDEHMQLLGQVAEGAGVPMPEVPTFLIAGDKLPSRAVTARLGEFRMRCRSEDDLRLCFAVDDDELIEVELDRRRSVTPSRPLLIDALFDRAHTEESRKGARLLRA